MVFNSYSFLLFFPIVLVLTQLAPAKWRNGLLLVASYVFYASWGKRFCVLLLGLTVASKMQAEYFLNRQTLMILALGLVAFVFDTIGGVLVAKVYNLFAKQKINPMIGAAGISAFPMSARVVNKMGLQEDNQNFLLMHAVGVNVSGQIASVIAGGMILTLFA